MTILTIRQQDVYKRQLFGSFQRGQGGERHSVGLFVAVYNGQRGFLGEVRRSGLDDAASGREAALLQGVILRGLLRQGHCGSDVLVCLLYTSRCV